MKFKIAMTFLALFMLAGTDGLTTAQNTTKTTHKKTRTLSGCLQRATTPMSTSLLRRKAALGRSRATASSSAIMSVIRLRLPA